LYLNSEIKIVCICTFHSASLFDSKKEIWNKKDLKKTQKKKVKKVYNEKHEISNKKIKNS